MPVTDSENVIARIFQIQRFSIHDGPGIRTTVFLKGCPLRCLWCHNPEGVHAAPQLSFDPARCIGCGYCFRVCEHTAHKMDAGRHVLDRNRCAACGSCTKECYAGALEMVGRDASSADVLAEVLRDRPFYQTSGGGVTLSGGEPLFQLDFTESLLRGAQAAGLHCAVETCGHVPWDRFNRVRPRVDLFLYDVKETDPRRHRQYTGVGNETILRNLRALHDAGAAVLVRLPVVPGLNDRPAHFRAVADLMASMPKLLGAELMPYHRLGAGKRRRLGSDSHASDDAPAPTDRMVAEWVWALRRMGVHLIGQTAERHAPEARIPAPKE